MDSLLDVEGANEVLLARLMALISQMEMWYNRKSDYWKQLSRDKYAKEIDRNSKYFHSIATFKKRKKHLLELNIEGRSIKEPRKIKFEARRYFKELCKQNDVPVIKIEDGLVKKIKELDAVNLELIPSEEEVKVAVWSCDPSKAPGSDGYNLNFIRKMWQVVGSDFTKIVLNFF